MWAEAPAECTEMKISTGIDLGNVIMDVKCKIGRNTRMYTRNFAFRSFSNMSNMTMDDLGRVARA